MQKITSPIRLFFYKIILFYPFFTGEHKLILYISKFVWIK